MKNLSDRQTISIADKKGAFICSTFLNLLLLSEIFKLRISNLWGKIPLF
jgi:hypothetical protein